MTAPNREEPGAYLDFEMDVRDPLEFMERLAAIEDQTGYSLSTELRDRLELPSRVRLHCTLDTGNGLVTINDVEQR